MNRLSSVLQEKNIYCDMSMLTLLRHLLWLTFACANRCRMARLPQICLASQFDHAAFHREWCCFLIGFVFPTAWLFMYFKQNIQLYIMASSLFLDDFYCPAF